ncbi:hypothetical protein N7537_010670 [Penicillium hordei]|uniref:Uncharacterized protein n=1 Tax=Penicillium hordei TaxID=40994 RepID=A0AAD6DVE5_9EURO|nr:uncharacterized protein N7537_010670 [Penicillium hordei]KAJ5593766.1 hypothetical protein N7537_010670 [Penicillium hordei]
MEHIGIETLPFANAIGKAYATLHRGTGINGDDVELVLGTSATGAWEEDYRPELQHRAVKLYFLDFGQYEAVDLTQDPDDAKKLKNKFNIEDFMQEYEKYAGDFL